MNNALAMEINTDNLILLASLKRGEQVEIDSLPDPSIQGIHASLDILHRQASGREWTQLTTTDGTRVIKRIK